MHYYQICVNACHKHLDIWIVFQHCVVAQAFAALPHVSAVYLAQQGHETWVASISNSIDRWTNLLSSALISHNPAGRTASTTVSSSNGHVGGNCSTLRSLTQLLDGSIHDSPSSSRPIERRLHTLQHKTLKDRCHHEAMHSLDQMLMAVQA